MPERRAPVLKKTTLLVSLEDPLNYPQSTGDNIESLLYGHLSIAF